MVTMTEEKKRAILSHRKMDTFPSLDKMEIAAKLIDLKHQKFRNRLAARRSERFFSQTDENLSAQIRECEDILRFQRE